MKNKIRYFLLLTSFPVLLFSCFEERERIIIDPFLGKQAARLSVGQSSNFILSDEKFTGIDLEIAYMEGYQPTREAVGNMGAFLQELANKPEGIVIYEQEIPAMGKETYSAEEIRQVEEEHRERYNFENRIAVFLLILDGNFEGDDDDGFVIGAAYQNTSMVLFGKRIAENSGGFRRPGRGVLESTVALHELGHLLGLVNFGSDMVHDHEDEENKYHCDNTDCLMYHAVETSNVFSFVGSSVPTLDENCRNDLKANGGR
jgi:predicted Zn-dependent protease